MNFAVKILPWLILLAPFLILAYFYNSLADPVLIARSFFDGEVILAPKTHFTVFRVPLIEVVCGAVIEIMRRPSNERNSKIDADYFLFWTILLYTVALKSVLQTIESVSPPAVSNYIYYITFATVICGIMVAAIAGRKLLSNFRNLTGKYNSWELVALVSLLIAYLGLAFIPVYVFS